MIFGDRVQVPTANTAATSVVNACRGQWWTVGWFVPEGYERTVRLSAPDPDLDDWWDAYRSLFRTIADVGRRHTSTPDRAWLAIWEGHGWETSTSAYAIQGQLDNDQRRAVRDRQNLLRAEDARRHASIRAGLGEVPRFDLPNRTYYLVEGPVAAVTELCEPGSPERWQRPELFWPDDRSWFVATDVDFWSLYVGGSTDFIAELIAAVPIDVEPVTLADALESED